jgi:predicted enzyme related to lactoylglutathione lyase
MLKIKESHAALPAQDMERARKFYEQKLGLTPDVVSSDGSIMFKTGNSSFSVFPSSGKASGDHTQVALQVVDVVATVNDLKKNGVSFEDYDFPGFKTEGGVLDMSGFKAAWFKDSEGNLLNLTQGMEAAAPAAGGRTTTTNGH